MNFNTHFIGVLKALGRASDWPDHFNLTRRGLKWSFLALFLTIPLYYIGALGVETQRAIRLGLSAPRPLPLAAFSVIALVYVMVFPACAYLLALVFDKQDRFRVWVIVRHWAVFFTTLIAAFAFGGYLMGVMTFGLANAVAFVTYMGMLAIDIRLAARLAEFEWGGAVLTGCIIHAMGLGIFLTGIGQFAL